MKVAWLKSHRYLMTVILILLVAAIFRFYHFPNRCGLAYDQARDVLVAREALRQGKLPLTGPFTSTANVVYGPQWFWLLALFAAPKLDSVFLPWLMVGLLYVAIVFLMIKVGDMLGGRELGLLAGALTAFSPLQVWQSLNLTTPNFTALLSVLAILVMLKYLKTEKSFWAFLLGTIIALAINIHLQAIGLLFLIPTALILGRKNRLAALAFLAVGFLLQFIPLLIFELRNDFYDLQGVVSYLTFGQYRLEGQTPWWVYLSSAWPKLWWQTTGGNLWLAYLQMAGIGFLLARQLLTKKLPKMILALVISFLLIFISLRFYRGAKFESYYAFTQPFILILAAWLVWRIYLWQKAVAMLFLLALLFGSWQLNLPFYQVEKNSYSLLKSWQETLVERFPGRKFSLYDYEFLSQDKTVSLSLVLAASGLIDDGGVKIGISRSPESISKETFYNQSYSLTDISQIKKESDKWAFLNPSEVWKATEEWYYK